MNTPASAVTATRDHDAARRAWRGLERILE